MGLIFQGGRIKISFNFLFFVLYKVQKQILKDEQQANDYFHTFFIFI
jgi:hypothetical protein